MATHQLEWSWRDKKITVGCDSSGTGPTVLLLPALSSISTRREMRPLQERLARHHRTVAIDWPGFGDQPRPAVDWAPEVYSSFLAFLLDKVVAHPHAVIAAGHAATYALAQAAARPKSLGGLVRWRTVGREACSDPRARREICIGPLRDRAARSAGEPRRISRSGAAGRN